MSRRHRAEKRERVPDSRYKSPLVSHLINMVMKNGKKTVAERIVYGAIERVSEKLEKGDPIDLLLGALENIRPKLEVKSRRVGGATYQVPVEVSFDRQQTLATARARPAKNRIVIGSSPNHTPSDFEIASSFA